MATLAHGPAPARRRRHAGRSPLTGAASAVRRVDADRGRLCRLCAVAALAGCAGHARCAVAADHRRRAFTSTSSRRRSACRCSASPGTQERVDLAYLWPSLTPPDPATANRQWARRSIPMSGCSSPSRRATARCRCSSACRRSIRAIWCRSRPAGPTGLTLRGFRDGTPYQGEELVFESGRARAFPGALLAQGRHQYRHLLAGAAHRQCRHHLALSARLADRLEKRRRRHRQTDGTAASELASALSLHCIYCINVRGPISSMRLTPVSAMLTSSSLRMISIALATPGSPPAPSP